MQVTLEPNTSQKIHQLGTWTINFRKNLDRKVLFRLATDPTVHVKNINVKLDAIIVIRNILEKQAQETHNGDLLTDEEIEKLFNLIKDDEDFPILLDTQEISVEQVTHIKNHEDLATKKKVKIDIEENDAVLKAEAALLIVDFGTNTKKFQQIRLQLIKTISAILGNMLCEKDHIFVREIKKGDKIEVITTNFFKQFVQALYFIDEEAAKPFMDIFSIKPEDFSFERRQRKVSQSTPTSPPSYSVPYIPNLVC